MWHNFSTDHINKLYKLQKIAARGITWSNYDSRSSQIFEALHWKAIKEILDEKQLVMTFKSLQGLGRFYITQLFNVNNITTHKLRSNNRYLHLSKPRTYRGAVSWNNLPKNLINEVATGNMSRRLISTR